MQPGSTRKMNPSPQPTGAEREAALAGTKGSGTRNGVRVLPNGRTTDRLIGQSARSSVRRSALDEEDEEIIEDGFGGAEIASAMSADDDDYAPALPHLDLPSRGRQAPAAPVARHEQEREKEREVDPEPRTTTAVTHAHIVSAPMPAPTVVKPSTHEASTEAAEAPRFQRIRLDIPGAKPAAEAVAPKRTLRRVLRVRRKQPWPNQDPTDWRQARRLIAISVICFLVVVVLAMLAKPSAPSGPTTPEEQNGKEKQR